MHEHTKSSVVPRLCDWAKILIPSYWWMIGVWWPWKSMHVCIVPCPTIACKPKRWLQQSPFVGSVWWMPLSQLDWYVGVIWFVFHSDMKGRRWTDIACQGKRLWRFFSFLFFIFCFRQLLPIRCTQRNLWCISKSIDEASKEKLDWRLEFSLFSYGYQYCMFVEASTEDVCPPNCVHYWGIEDIVQMSFYMCVYASVCFLILTWYPTNQI